MPFYKFRSIEELDSRHQDLCCKDPGEDWFRRVAKLWETSARLNPRRFPPGVYRYRDLAEAQAERERWLREHVTNLARSRRSHEK